MKKQEKQLGISRFVPLVLISALGSLRAIPLLMSVSNTRSAGERLAALPSLCSLPRISASGERRLLYVHVGKTGGTTLDKVLRSNCEMYRLYGEHNTARKCLSALERGGGGESYLSNITAYTLHTRGSENVESVMRENNITSFLWTLRNPISRFVSAFNMRHPNNSRAMAPSRNKLRREYRTRVRSEFYSECFPTVEHLATIMAEKKKKFIQTVTHVSLQSYQGDEIPTKEMDCFDLGVSALRGNGLELINEHILYNYRRYASFTVDVYPNVEILAIRTEHLWHDTKTLNQLLLKRGEEQTSLADSRRGMPQVEHTFSYGSEQFEVKSDLTAWGKAILCCFLSEEIVVFVNLTLQASNLCASEKEKYLEQIWGDCGLIGLQKMHLEIASALKERCEEKL